jgi:hypothetical protein
VARGETRLEAEEERRVERRVIQQRIEAMTEQQAEAAAMAAQRAAAAAAATELRAELGGASTSQLLEQLEQVRQSGKGKILFSCYSNKPPATQYPTSVPNLLLTHYSLYGCTNYRRGLEHLRRGGRRPRRARRHYAARRHVPYLSPMP